MSKPFTVAFIKDLEKLVSLGKISYSRMVEILNEKSNFEINSKNKKENEDGLIDVEIPLNKECISKFGNLVVENLTNELENFIKFDNDFITDFNKLLCDKNGSLYNVLSYTTIEEDVPIIDTIGIKFFFKKKHTCLKLDKEINVGEMLYVVHKKYSDE